MTMVDTADTSAAAADRAAYPRTALTRLAISAAAADLADKATDLVAPDPEEDPSDAGDLVGAAASLVRMAEELRRAAVVHARAGDTRWRDIGAHLGTTRQSAQSTYAGSIAAWEGALRRAPHTDPGAQHPYLPEAALYPTATAQRLDTWLRERGHGDDERPVSATLPKLTLREAMARILEALRHAAATGAPTHERARLQDRKVALLERIAAESGRPEDHAAADEARAYAAHLHAQN